MGKSLLARVLLALAAVGLVPLGAVSWQLARLNRDAMTAQVLRTHAIAARTAAERAAAFLEVLGRSGEAVAHSEQWEDGARAAPARDLVASALQADARLAGLAVTDSAGAEVFR